MGKVRAALAGLLLIPLLAAAAEVVESSVVLDADVYAIDVLVRIDAPLDVVFRAITDYDRLTEINPSIVESHILERQGKGRYRVYTRIKLCVLFFCKEFRQVQDIVEQGNVLVKATILPESSDFESGSASWDLVVADGVTYMEFSAKVDPSFWVPPLIGTWLFEREMTRQVMATASYIEKQASGQNP